MDGLREAGLKDSLFRKASLLLSTYARKALFSTFEVAL